MKMFSLVLSLFFGVAITQAQSTFTVTRSDDRNGTCSSGDCSLREAINASNAELSDDTINFASTVNTVMLTAEIVIKNAGTLTVNGRGANVFTIDGGIGTNRIFYTDSAAVTISGATLTGGNGGGITGGNGGAIYANGGALALDNVHVTLNSISGTDAGGVVLFLGGTNHRIINSTFSVNQSADCAGFYNFNGTLTVVNSTISGNTALLTVGGGFCSGGASSSTTLRNVTITNNTAPSGGGIYHFGGSLNFGNTIIAGNTETSGYRPEIDFREGTITSAGNNLIGNSTGDAADTGLVITYKTSDIRDANPLLGGLQNNGGQTLTQALLTGSPAIDAGSNALAVDPSNGNAALAFDQKGIGFIRIRDGNGDGTSNADIGAFEAQTNSTASGTALFDFDGDGKADVSVFRPDNGAWYLQQSQNGFTGVTFGFGSDKIVPADYDGDGKTDVAVYRAGTWYLQRSQLGFTGVAFGEATDIPVPADYDGDGKADIAVFRPSNGTWYLLQSTAGFAAIAFGQAGDIPVAADYDGDGKTDVAVFRGGTWYILRSQLGFTGVAFGENTDKPVVGDYDGDAKADVAVFRPSNGAWYLLRSQLGFTGISFGFGTDVPVPADYDGDGKTDVSVFRNGTWYLNRSQAGFTGVAFGEATDKPVPNAFIP